MPKQENVTTAKHPRIRAKYLIGYSSIFIASPCYVGMFKAWPRLKHTLGLGR